MFDDPKYEFGFTEMPQQPTPEMPHYRIKLADVFLGLQQSMVRANTVLGEQSN
jgi:hypothetical protein